MPNSANSARQHNGEAQHDTACKNEITVLIIYNQNIIKAKKLLHRESQVRQLFTSKGSIKQSSGTPFRYPHNGNEMCKINQLKLDFLCI